MENNKYIKPPRLSASFSKNAKEAKRRFSNILNMNKRKSGLILLIVVIILAALCAGAVVNGSEKLSLKKETEHFQIYAKRINEETLSSLAMQLEEYLANESGKLYYDASNLKCRVDVYPDIRSFHVGVGAENKNDNYVIHAFEDGKRIAMASPDKVSVPKENMDYSVKYGVNCIAIINAFADAPEFLTNAVMAYENGLVNDLALGLEEAMRKTDFPEYGELQSMSEEEQAVYGYTLAEFISQKFMYSTLNAFMQNPDIEAVLGISEEEFNAQWENYARTVHPAYEAQTESDNFVIYAPADDPTAQDTLDSLEKFRSRMSEELDLSTAQKYSVYIYPTLDLANKNSPWYTIYNRDSTCYGIGNGIIKTVSSNSSFVVNNETGVLYVYLAGVAGEKNPNVPAYIITGTAGLLSEANVGVKTNIGNMLSQNSLPGFEKLKYLNIEYAGGEAYAASYSFIEYIAESYGMDKVKELIENPSPEKVLSKNTATIEREWHEFVHEKYGH